MIEELDDLRVRSGAELAELWEAGELPTDGSVLIPFTYLWYRSELVASELERGSRGDTVLRKGLETPRCATDAYQLRRNAWISLATADRILTRHGVPLFRLGDPIFARHPSELPA